MVRDKIKKLDGYWSTRTRDRNSGTAKTDNATASKRGLGAAFSHGEDLDILHVICRLEAFYSCEGRSEIR